MCINPSIHEGKAFACRKCWQCKENAIQDWVGRCIAESRVASASYAVTFTYGGGDHAAAYVLTYSHVQKMFKLMRWHGYTFKFFVAGEYGTRKGRAHWHAILFFHGKVPKIDKLRRRFDFEFWPHGHTLWDKISPKSVRYVCKYLRKNGDEKEEHSYFSMSKAPPIGDGYFRQLALRYVEQGNSPRDLKYSFAENKDKDGKVVQHYMHGATARNFLDAFMDAWQARFGNTNWPNSTLVDEAEDRKNKWLEDPILADRRYGVVPRWLPFRDCVMGFSEVHNSYITNHQGTTYWWRPVDYENPKGVHAWRAKDGRKITWEQSDRYKDLSREGERLKRERDETMRQQAASSRSTTSPANGGLPLQRSPRARQQYPFLKQDRQ